MKTASPMVQNDKLLCVEVYDSDENVTTLLRPDELERLSGERVVVWGNGEYLPSSVDLKKLFFDRHNFYVSLRAFGPFKSIKPAVQLYSIVRCAQERKRVFWTTRAGVQKAWFDPLFLKL